MGLARLLSLVWYSSVFENHTNKQMLPAALRGRSSVIEVWRAFLDIVGVRVSRFPNLSLRAYFYDVHSSVRSFFLKNIYCSRLSVFIVSKDPS